MTADIATVRTAAEVAAAPAPATLDATTVAAVTDLLRAAAAVARDSRPIVLQGPVPAPAVAPQTAAAGAHAYIPGPPATERSAAVSAAPARRLPVADRVLWAGVGVGGSGVVGAILAAVSGSPAVLLVTAAGMVLIGGAAAAINRAEDLAHRG